MRFIIDSHYIRIYAMSYFISHSLWAWPKKAVVSTVMIEMLKAWSLLSVQSPLDLAEHMISAMDRRWWSLHESCGTPFQEPLESLAGTAMWSLGKGQAMCRYDSPFIWIVLWQWQGQHLKCCSWELCNSHDFLFFYFYFFWICIYIPLHVFTTDVVG